MGEEKKIIPIGGRVLIKRDLDANEQKAAKLGLVMSNYESKEMYVWGTIVHPGTCPFVKKGDCVLFSDINSDRFISAHNVQYDVVMQDSVLGILKK